MGDMKRRNRPSGSGTSASSGGSVFEEGGAMR